MISGQTSLLPPTAVVERVTGRNATIGVRTRSDGAAETKAALVSTVLVERVRMRNAAFTIERPSTRAFGTRYMGSSLGEIF